MLSVVIVVSVDPDISALYLRCGAGFYGSGTVWANIAVGEVRASFIVAALLRSVEDRNTTQRKVFPV